MRPAIVAVLFLAFTAPASAGIPPGGVIRVTVTCPGADAHTLDETVLNPIYRQINGVEGMTRIESEARNDGTGMLNVYFRPRADMDLAEVRVHNRVNLCFAPDSRALSETGDIGAEGTGRAAAILARTHKFRPQAR